MGWVAVEQALEEIGAEAMNNYQRNALINHCRLGSETLLSKPKLTTEASVILSVNSGYE